MDNCLIILVAHFPRKSIVFLSGERTERITMNRVVSLKERSDRSAFVLVESKCCDISRAKIIFRDNEFSRAEGKRGEGGQKQPFLLENVRSGTKRAEKPRIARPER